MAKTTKEIWTLKERVGTKENSFEKETVFRNEDEAVDKSLDLYMYMEQQFVSKGYSIKESSIDMKSFDDRLFHIETDDEDVFYEGHLTMREE